MAPSIDRRRFIACALASAAPRMFAHPLPATPASPGARSLAGRWRFALDREDVGAGARWHAGPLPAAATIALPGILQTQGYGNEITAETPFVAALPRDMRWYLLPQYQAYTKPGNVQVPYLSQPVRHYLGVAWYQREIVIPPAWHGKRIALTLERPRWHTSVYLDDRPVGTCRSLVAPHEFELGLLDAGRHRLSVRIDNRMQQPDYRPDGHAVSDAEGATWNGIAGRIELRATSPVWIADAQVYPDLAANSARVRLAFGNLGGRDGNGTVSAGGVTLPVRWTADGGTATLEVPLPHARPWSEFTPELQHLTVALSGSDAADQRRLSFGMREIKTDGNRILLNGDQFHLRATHDGGGFPLTGFPAMDVATWKRIIGICKEWGLNGMRFHSWCPPQAAFVAADELGFYMQPECGMWNAFDSGHRMLDLLNDETARLLKAYGNHPSLVMLGASNEPAGAYHTELPLWDAKWRAADPRRLYCDGPGRWPAPPGGPGTPFAADYLVTGTGARGTPGWMGADYEQGLNKLRLGTEIPCIAHEIGQYCAYPDFDVIAKFNGKQQRYAAFADGVPAGMQPYMHPGNYLIMRDSARAHGLLARNREFAQASGRFQVACYKEEIEANLRTPSYSGYQLLELHDYLGQGGALVGVLDAFWESKGYVTARQFRQFSGPTVPLARLARRVFTTGDTLAAAVEMMHFGPQPIAKVALGWRIVDEAGRAWLSGSLPVRDLPRGKNIAFGTIHAALSALPAPAAYRLEVAYPGTEIGNSWSLWVYPPAPASAGPGAPDGVLVTASWDAAREALSAGGKVLLLSGQPGAPAPELALSRTPIFWNRLMNPKRTWMLGLWIDARHAALKGYPSAAHCDWQWVSLLGDTTAMNIETLPAALAPIVLPIDDWNRNLRLAMLFECQAGPGRLVVSAFDLSDQAVARDAGAGALRDSLLAHLASPAGTPAASIALAALEAWMAARHRAPPMVLSPPASGDVADPG
ncbi:Beta-galactosidase/beta-glucuronidase [Duganella sp. CF517]|uniref:sugar-binding domain-containing protein n=1 Tax=Duganella sp. CF517 TaxID=1881038 RepID=UPI0008AFC4A3|nr:sugar-binding domain-containing protein [Duganella sp. CF517]SEN10222.1 Beta-galactosidase/beta-glucuronidase [Duganella sp. CF517]